MKINCIIRGHPPKERLEKALAEFIWQTKKGTTRK